jgi:hypothetical protein
LKQTKREEPSAGRLLHIEFGETYEQYRKRSGFLVPRLRRAEWTTDNEKRQGRRPAVFDVETCPLLHAVYSFPQFSPGSKLRNLPSSDFDGGARLWVPSIAGLSLRHREGAKTNQSYPISFFQSRSNTLYCRVDGSGGLRFTDATSGCNAVNEIGFVHRLSKRVSFVLKKRRKMGAPPEILKPGGSYLAPV